jgi:putative ABC transport system substrate-binding protein
MKYLAGRREVLRLSGRLALGGLAATALAACGEDDKPKHHVVGWLNTNPPEASNEDFAALLGRLGELGYAIGDPSAGSGEAPSTSSSQSLTWDYAPLRTELLSDFAAGSPGLALWEHYLTRVREMLEAGASAILALENEAPPFGGPTVSAATSVRVPVVCLFNIGPGTFPGIIDSYARPGRNITGVTTLVPDEDLWSKRLELLRMAFPATRRVGFFTDPSNPAIPFVQAAAGGLGLDLLVLEVPDTQGDWASLFARASGLGLQAVVNGGRGRFADPRVYDFADQNRLPSVGILRGRVTLYYALNRPALFRRVAEMLDLVLQGTDPRDIPVELPAKFDFVIDLAKARSAGLTASPAALALATEVVQ